MGSEVGDDIVTEFYGIDPVTGRTDSVAISRGGRISHVGQIQRVTSPPNWLEMMLEPKLRGFPG